MLNITGISKRFKTGLKKYNISLEDLKQNYYYMGGTTKNHLIYFKNNFNEKLPEFDNYCICGHKIKTNCYITDGENILILGENCIANILNNKKKSCIKCSTIHRNKMDNLCKLCRKKFSIEKKNIILTFN